MESSLLKKANFRPQKENQSEKDISIYFIFKVRA